MSGKIPIFQVDSFTNHSFAGNPAGVCLLERGAPEEWMQLVAAEMNVSETAFVTTDRMPFAIRYFTPNVEVPLCGHATLATAHILWEEGVVPASEDIEFSCPVGLLGASRDGKIVHLDLPATPPEGEDVLDQLPADMVEAIGKYPTGAFYAGDPPVALFLYSSAEEVAALTPDFARLMRKGYANVIATAPAAADSSDFVSRFFAPEIGIDEDPVTGWAHTVLAPFWGERLGKEKMTGLQISARGGEVLVRTRGERVDVGGEAVTMIRGELLAGTD